MIYKTCDIRSKRIRQNINIRVSGESTINRGIASVVGSLSTLLSSNLFEAFVCCTPLIQHRIDSTQTAIYQFRGVVDKCEGVISACYIHLFGCLRLRSFGCIGTVVKVLATMFTERTTSNLQRSQNSLNFTLFRTFT